MDETTQNQTDDQATDQPAETTENRAAGDATEENANTADLPGGEGEGAGEGQI